jgi:hypothetical protein
MSLFRDTCIVLLALITIPSWPQQSDAPSQSDKIPTPDLADGELRAKFVNAPSGPERDYLAGILAARDGRDDESIRLLTRALPALRKSRQDEASMALRLLANVYDRQGDYARSAPLYDDLEHFGLRQRLPATYRGGAHDDAELARVLASSPAQTLTWTGPVQLRTSRDNALGVITTQLTVNGVRSEWILDTGANESVISRSFASQLHLSILPGVAHTSGGITGTENELHVALLPNLLLGGATAHNVVLLVLDDASLTIPDGNGHTYRIAGIIGFPVLRALGRITFHHDGTFDATPNAGSKSDGSPLRLRLLNPVVEGDFLNQHLPFTLDTGASGTTLSVRFYDRFKAEEPTWKKAGLKSFNAGGSTTTKSFLVPSLTLGVGGRNLTLHNLPVIPAVQNADIDALFGNLGEDLFQSVESFTFDFRNMRFVMGAPLSSLKATKKD